VVAGNLAELFEFVSGDHPPIADLLPQAALPAELANAAGGDAKSFGGLIHGNQRKGRHAHASNCIMGVRFCKRKRRP